MFFSLGLKNAWRNRGRTALGIVSMAIATLIFLSSTTLSMGYPAQAYMPVRRLIGGDLVLLPGKYSLSQEDMAGGYVWKFGQRSLDKPNPAMGLDTEPYSYGGIQGFSVEGDGTITASRFQEVMASLNGNPSVRMASIRRSLPFIVTGSPSYQYGFLDARNVQEDLTTWDMSSSLVGYYLDRTDEVAGVMVRGWSNLELPGGGIAGIEIPTYTPAGPDYENSITENLMIIGMASFVEGVGMERPQILSTPAVFVTNETLDYLATVAGYPDEATYWGISVTLNDMATAENVLALLRREFSDFTVVSAPQLSAAATGLTVSTGVPMDMRRVTEAIAFVTAALLSATNLTILMLSRKSEIGILRALGATRGNISAMVLTESIVISLMGAIIGGIITQPAILWQLMSNSVKTGIVTKEVLGGLGKSLAFAIAAATVFGFLPVAKALRVTPAQVMRGE